MAQTGPRASNPMRVAAALAAEAGVFLAEPPSRLRMIVVYTHWRVFQTLLANRITRASAK